jgi:hypothetical protein
MLHAPTLERNMGAVYPCLALRGWNFLTFAATQPYIGRDLAYIGCRTGVHLRRVRVALMSNRPVNSLKHGQICYAAALCKAGLGAPPREKRP